MSMDILTLDSDAILHETKVDFKLRTIQKTIHLVQYEKNLPIIAVSLMYNGYSYTLPEAAEVWIRWGKKDRTYVYKKCSVSEDRKTVYFEVDYQMTYFYGELDPILELIIGSKSAGSSPIPVVIDRNPIQEGDVESQISDDTLAELREDIYDLNVGKQDKLTFDTTPRMGSINPVTSEGIKMAIADSQAHGIYNYKGQVPSYSNLPTSGVAIGDVWEAIDTGINWAWNGTSWDNKGTGFKAQLNLVLTSRDYKHATDSDDGRELEVARALQADEAAEADLAKNLITDKGAQVEYEKLEISPVEVSIKEGSFASVNGVKGNSVAWNQLISFSISSGSNHGISASIFNNVVTSSGTAEDDNINIWFKGEYNTSNVVLSVKQNHKYLIKDVNLYIKNSGSTGAVVCYLGDAARIFTPLSDVDFCGIRFPQVTTGNTYNKVFNPLLIDLTQVFGVGNEPTSVDDARVQWLIAHAKKHQRYDAGSIVDSKPVKLYSRKAGLNSVPLKSIGAVKAKDLDWTLSPSGNFFSAYYASLKNSTVSTVKPNVLSAEYTTETPGNVYDGLADKAISTGTGNETFWIRDTSYNDATAFKNHFGDDDYIYFELKTPYASPAQAVLDRFVLGEYPLTLPTLRSAGSAQDTDKKANVGHGNFEDLTWGTSSAIVGAFWAEIAGMKQIASVDFLMSLNLDRYTSAASLNNASSGYFIDHTTNRLFIKDPSITSSSQIVGEYNYELATPTAQQGVILPDNVVAETGGTLEVEYEAGKDCPSDFSVLYQVSMAGFLEDIGARDDIQFTAAEIVSQTQLQEGLDQKADIIALKEGFIVPMLAEDLTPYSDESGDFQSEPFLFQGSGTADGTQSDFSTGVNAQLREKRGNSVVWNQLNASEISYTATAGVQNSSNISSNISFVSGHKYLITYYQETTMTSNIRNTVSAQGVAVSQESNRRLTKGWYSDIYNCQTTGASTINIWCHTPDANVTYSHCRVIDLGTEAATITDPKVKWALQYATLHPEYSDYKLLNSDGRYLKTIGKNQWDEEWEVGSITGSGNLIDDPTRIRSKNFNVCMPNTTLYGYVGSNQFTFIIFYDKNYNFISYTYFKSGTIEVPSDAGYFKLTPTSDYGNTYHNDISVYIAYWADPSDHSKGLDGDHYTTYTPYEVLSEVDTGEEVLRSAESIYDIKVPNGTITRRIYAIDLGTLTWTYYSGSGHLYFRATLSPLPKRAINGRTKANLISAKYVNDTGDNVYNNVTDKTISIPADNDIVMIYDTAYTDAATFKAAMSGVYLYYELATPTTEQGTPFNENLRIDDFGSMLWLKDDGESGKVPAEVKQGNLIFYPVNYKGYLDTLYNYTNGTPSKLVLRDEFEDAIEQKADIIALEEGLIIPNKALQTKSIEAVSLDSGHIQDTPFIYQGTGTANGTSIADTSPVGKHLEKQGNSVVVNQLFDTENATLERMTKSGDVFTVSENGSSCSIRTPGYLTSGHKYIIICTYNIIYSGNGTSDEYTFSFYANGQPNHIASNRKASISGFLTMLITKNDVMTHNYYGFHCWCAGSTLSLIGSTISKPLVIDLTQWFNGDVPQDLLDHPENFFRYYNGSLAYNAGSLENGTGRYLTCGGRNVWDEEWERGFYDSSTGVKTASNVSICSKNLIKVNPNTDYYIYGDSRYTDGFKITCFGASGNYLGPGSVIANKRNATFKVPADCYYIAFNTYNSANITAYNHDITISLYYTTGDSYDQYFPYEKPKVYDTGDEVLLAFDKKHPDGMIERNTVIPDLSQIDMSLFNYENSTNSVHPGYTVIFITARNIPSSFRPKSPVNSTTKANLICDKFITVPRNGSPSLFNVGYNAVAIQAPTQTDSNYYLLFSRVGSFTKQEMYDYAVASVIQWEAATQTTEQGTPFAENIEINDYGTMGWDSEVPQGCKIFYPADYVLAIDTLGQRPDINWDMSQVASKSETASIAVEKMAKGSDDVSNFYANEGDLNITPLSNEISGIYFTFAHWRVSNGRLSIFLKGYTNNLKTRSSNGLISYATDAANRFDLPSWVWNKLIPSIEVTDNTIVGMLASQEKKTIHSNNDYQSEYWSEGVNLRAAVYKIKSNRVGIAFSAEGAQRVTDNLNYEFHYEFNFML